MQLPIVLQVLLSQDYRAHALSLLAQLLDMGAPCISRLPLIRFQIQESLL